MRVKLSLRDVVLLAVLLLVTVWLLMRQRGAQEEAALLYLSYAESQVRHPGEVAIKVGEEFRSKMPPAKARRFDDVVSRYQSMDFVWWSRYQDASRSQKELMLKERLAQQKRAEGITDETQQLEALNAAVHDALKTR